MKELFRTRHSHFWGADQPLHNVAGAASSPGPKRHALVLHGALARAPCFAWRGYALRVSRCARVRTCCRGMRVQPAGAQPVRKELCAAVPGSLQCTAG